MAGEIQLNSTTLATESTGTITLTNVDSATNRTNLGLGSLATQNANAVALTGGSITGTEVDLKSTGTSVYKSDGSTAVISESSGTVTVNNATLGSSVVFPSGIIIGSAFNNYTDTTNTAVGSNNGFVDCTGSETYLTIKSTSSKFYVVWMNSLSNATTGGRAVLNVYYKKTDSGGSGGSYVSITGVTSGANLGVTQSSQPHDSSSNDTYTGMLEISNQSQSVGDRLYCKVMIAASISGRTIRNNRNSDGGLAYTHRTISSLQIFEVAQ